MTDDTDRLIDNLERMNALREAPLRAAIEALHLPPGSRGLDIGCGTGDPALMMAEATGPDGHVTGLDISRPVLDNARRKASRSGCADRIAFEQGDMRALPFAPASFDWAWSVDCVGYPSADLLPILMGIRRVVRPGGVIALLAWSSQQLLPGYSLLEARLNATCSAYAPFLESQPPQAHFQRALHWFPQAGLTDATCTTFVGQVQAPLRPEIRPDSGTGWRCCLRCCGVMRSVRPLRPTSKRIAGCVRRLRQTSSPIYRSTAVSSRTRCSPVE